MTRHRLTVAVMSGRFDGNNAGVKQDWRNERKVCSLLLGTELAHRVATDLIGPDDKFGLIHVHGVGQGENAVEYRKSVLELVTSFYLLVLRGGGTGRFSSDAYALVSVFKHVETGRYVVDIQNHDPAHNLPASKFWRPGNMARWHTVKRAEAKAMRGLEVEFPGGIYLVSGDSNAPPRAPWFLRAMARLFPGFRDGGGYEFGALWVKGARGAWHSTVKAHGSDHSIRRVGLIW